MTAQELKEALQTQTMNEALMKLYIDPDLLAYQKKRYAESIDRFLSYYDDGDLHLFSAPGRTEIGGNHTDHQRGKVLAASLNLDIIAVVKKTDDGVIRLKSKGYREDVVDLATLVPQEKEKDHSPALIRGVAAAFQKNGHHIGGFEAYTMNDVKPGSGMSSSAAFEILVATVLNSLYNDGAVSAVDLAKYSQYAENVFFGKPSGLLDQMACSVGGLINIDFAEKENPKIRPLHLDFGKFGYALCITDTKGSHADLTPDYAAVPKEMKEVAAFFGKTVLEEVPETEFYQKLTELRTKLGDRPVLRSLHWYSENKRVDGEVTALEEGDFTRFLQLVKASGDSSYKYLQNVYSVRKLNEQGLS
ncbi:MAG TPA: galactokinase family protein, partial [Clostridiales bacterium]|nr:galactokinase family protein [Clostridiales bacterium]